MTKAVADPRDGFVESINLERSRIQLEPHIVFVCGGPVDIRKTNNHSIRNMFMNLSGGVGDKANGFVLAENFEDWNKGYNSLSDFENDIAFLSSLVVVFLESEGALTEFGLFFANKNLRKKLVVVLHEEFHKSKSFIKFGLLDPMEQINQNSVLSYEIDHREIESVSRNEVNDILVDILEHSDEIDKSKKFDNNDRGHQIFLIYQIIELFSALTKSEIVKYAEILKISFRPKEIDSALYILGKFNLIEITKKSSQYFYYVPTKLTNRIVFYFKKLERRFDAASIKIEVNSYYHQASKSEPGHKRRLKVIQKLSETVTI